MNTWEVEHARLIGAEVRRLRKEAGRSAQWLSERTDELGLKMTRQAIADLENGRRRYVTTAELVILSIALDSTPVSLVYPGPYTRMVELIPGIKQLEFLAAEWFSGNTYWKAQDPQESREERDRSVLMEKNSRYLYINREYFQAIKILEKLKNDGDFERDREHIEHYEKRARELGNEIDEITHARMYRDD